MNQGAAQMMEYDSSWPFLRPLKFLQAPLDSFLLDPLSLLIILKLLYSSFLSSFLLFLSLFYILSVSPWLLYFFYLLMSSLPVLFQLLLVYHHDSFIPSLSSCPLSSCCPSFCSSRYSSLTPLLLLSLLRSYLLLDFSELPSPENFFPNRPNQPIWLMEFS